MQKNNVGKIKNILFNEEDGSLELTVSITDPKFKKKILRDLSLSGKLIIENDKIIFVSGDDDA